VSVVQDRATDFLFVCLVDVLKLIQGGSWMAKIFTLVVSTNRGRYALGCPDGVDVTGGTRLVVSLGGYWIPGIVEHGRVCSGEDGIEHGYFFTADSGECCGLCAGMQVQVQ
jgi:hypothetical protein